MTGWKHDELLADLAGHLNAADRMIWTDMQLGPSGSPRPDIYVLQKSYSKPQPTAYEIKVSRSDLRSDTTSGKWQAYLKYAGAVVFAVPDGLCSPDEIPAGCGLIVRKAQVWRNVRKPVRQAIAALPMDVSMKLLIDGVARCFESRLPTPRRLELWVEHAAVRKKFGAEVANCARDIVAAQQRLDSARSQANHEWDQMRRQVEAQKSLMIANAKNEIESWSSLRSDVLGWLGLPADTSAWAARRKLQDLKVSCDADARVERAESDLSRARHALQTAIGYLTPKGEAA